MKKRIPPLSAFLLTILLLAGVANTSKATHASLMEMTYQHISGNTYEITLIFYRDCSPSSAIAPPSFQLGVKSNSLGVITPNAASLAMLPAAPSVSLNPPNLYNCSTRPLCYQEYEYRGNVNLSLLSASPQADDWVFFAELCCYSAKVTNIGAGSIYTEAGLNNKDFPGGNDAPFWHERRPVRTGYLMDTVISYPIKSVCENKEVSLKQHVQEYEGDLVKYEFIRPMHGNGLPAFYLPPHSLSYPLPFHTPPGFEIDSMTGEITLKAATPVSFGVYVVAIKATEYRTVGPTVTKEIGYVIRHLSIIVEPAATCPGSNITLDTKQKSISCADTSIVIEVSNTFQCATADIDASFIELIDSTSGVTIPVKSVSVNSCWNNSIASKFEVNLNNPLSVGEYFLRIVSGTDGNTIVSECGTELPALQDTVRITMDSVPVPSLLGSLDGLGGRYSYIEANCGQITLEVTLNTKVRCSSIEPGGSDFLIIDSTGATPVVGPLVVSATSVACNNNQTSKVELTVSPAFEGGNYGLFLKQGTDGNTVQNICGEEAIGGINSIQLQVPEVAVDLGPDLEYCKDSIFMTLLDAGPGYSYLWNTRDTVQQIIVVVQGIYTVRITNEYGCQAYDTLLVSEKDCSGGTGITEELEKNISIYPNPSTGNIYIQNNGKSKLIQILVKDINGKEVYNVTEEISNAGKQMIDLSGNSKGIYFIQLQANGQLLKMEKVVLK